LNDIEGRKEGRKEGMKEERKEGRKEGRKLINSAGIVILILKQFL